MTAPDFEIEVEAEPVEASHLYSAWCLVCGTQTLAAPRQRAAAMCGPCRLRMAQESAAIPTLRPDQRLPVREVGVEKILAQNGAERVRLVPPESVCPVLVYGSGEPSCGHGAPAPVRDLAGSALSHGWSVARGHSRGGVVGGTGKQLAVADLWSVRFRRDGWMGYAVRRGATWDSVCVAGETLPPFMALGVTELHRWLAQPQRDASWYGEVLKRRAGQALAAKIVKCPGPGECEWVDAGRGPHTHRGDGSIKIKNNKKEAAHGA